MHAALCIHDDDLFLEPVLRSVGEVPKLVFVSRVPWGGAEAGDWSKSVETAEVCGAEVVLGDWADETSHRRFALDFMKKRGCRHVLIPDSDEVLEPRLLEHLKRIAEADLADVVHARMDTYRKSPATALRHPELLPRRGRWLADDARNPKGGRGRTASVPADRTERGPPETQRPFGNVLNL